VLVVSLEKNEAKTCHGTYALTELQCEMLFALNEAPAKSLGAREMIQAMFGAYPGAWPSDINRTLQRVSEGLQKALTGSGYALSWSGGKHNGIWRLIGDEAEIGLSAFIDQVASGLLRQADCEMTTPTAYGHRILRAIRSTIAMRGQDLDAWCEIALWGLRGAVECFEAQEIGRRMQSKLVEMSEQKAVMETEVSE
jgi:hypothetical protein